MFQYSDRLEWRAGLGSQDEWIVETEAAFVAAFMLSLFVGNIGLAFDVASREPVVCGANNERWSGALCLF